MGMRTNHEARPPVAEITHCLLLARGLAVKIDDDAIGPASERTRCELALDRDKGIVERVHEDSAHGVDDQRTRAVFGFDQGGAASRRARRIIDRTDQTRRSFDEYQRLFLIPGVIAECDRVDAAIDQLTINGLGDAEAAGGILGIGDDQIELPVTHKPGQPLVNDATPAATDDIADEKNPHAAHGFRKSIVSFSVSTRSSGASKAVIGTVSIS